MKTKQKISLTGVLRVVSNQRRKSKSRYYKHFFVVVKEALFDLRKDLRKEFQGK
jgi:hypothetical protein